MSFYSDQAKQFQKTADELETKLTNEGATLDEATFSGLEKQRDSLLDQADAMITADLQGTLAGLKLDEPRLAKCTVSLTDAVKSLKRFDQIAAVVAAAITLATAIASGNPGSILSGLDGAEKAVAAVLPKPQAVPGAPKTADSQEGLALAASADPESSGS